MSKFGSEAKKGALKGAARGILNPLVTSAAKWMDTNVPKDSWLRTEAGDNFVNGLTEFAESIAESYGAVPAVLADAVADVFEKAHLTDKNKPAAQEVKIAAETWGQNFMKFAERKINSAKFEELPALKVRLMTEFEVKTALWEEIRKLAEVAKTPGVTPTKPPRRRPSKLKKVAAKAAGVLRFVNDAIAETSLAKKGRSRQLRINPKAGDISAVITTDDWIETSIKALKAERSKS